MVPYWLSGRVAIDMKFLNPNIMRKLILILMGTIVLSCTNEQTASSEASFLQSANAKGKPANFFNGGTATGDIIIDGAGYKLRFENFSDVTFDNNAYMHFTNYYYMRRESTKSDVGNYRFLEETSDRDWLATVSNANTGRGTRLFLDGNPNSSNFELLSEEGNSGIKGFRGNNAWFAPENLKTYETVEDAKANGIYGWFKTSDGTLKTTN